MNNTVTALQNLYIAKGGNLPDTYPDIADGVLVENMTTIPDLINALAKLENKG